MLRWRIIGIIACLDCLVWACQPTPATPKATFTLPLQMDFISEPLAPTFTPEVMLEWGEECAERFGRGVVVVGCHGWYAVNGDWLVLPTALNDEESLDRPWPVETLIKYEKAAHPGHIIVLLCCNVDHVTLHGFAGVWYSPNEVWVTPDKFEFPAEQLRRHLVVTGPSGSADCFVEAK